METCDSQAEKVKKQQQQQQQQQNCISQPLLTCNQNLQSKETTTVVSDNCCNVNSKVDCQDELQSARVENDELRAQLTACKQEIQSLTAEMDEMRDNFKEDESEQFGTTKQELDAALKACRTLQYRLNKSERQCAQLDKMKSLLDAQLLQAQQKLSSYEINSDVNQTSNKINNNITKNNCDYQSTNSNNNNSSNDETSNNAHTQYVKLTRAQYDELARKLDDANERERDFQEQLKFALEDLQNKSEKLLSIETENEILVTQLAKLTAANSRLKVNQQRLRQKVASCERQESFASTDDESTSANAYNNQELVDYNLATQQQQTIEQLRLSLEFAEMENEKLRKRLETLNSSSKQTTTTINDNNNNNNRNDTDNQQQNNFTVAQQQREAALATLESSLVVKLKAELGRAEQELADCRARLVELELTASRQQREQKRMREAFENEATSDVLARRRVHLPPLDVRAAWPRQQLNDALSEFDAELNQLAKVVAAKDRLIKEQASKLASVQNTQLNQQQQQQQASTTNATFIVQTADTSTINDEQLAIAKAKCTDLESRLASLTAANKVLQETVGDLSDKLRTLRDQLEDLKAQNSNLRQANQQLQQQQQQQQQQQVLARKPRLPLVRQGKSSSGGSSSSSEKFIDDDGDDSNDYEQCRRQRANESSNNNRDDAEELVRKLHDENDELTKKLEQASVDSRRQLAALRRELAAQKNKELDELRDLNERELEALRTELGEKLLGSARESARLDKQLRAERDAKRILERSARQDKLDAQKQLEIINSQNLTERRALESRLRAADAEIRDKQREILDSQEKLIQAEREVSRLRQKLSLTGDELTTTSNELCDKRREVRELSEKLRTLNVESVDATRKLSAEKETLVETLESIKAAYDEKIIELRRAKQLIELRNEQAFKDRTMFANKVDELERQIIELRRADSKLRLLESQGSARESQRGDVKRELAAARDEKLRLKLKVEELERKCRWFERRELCERTSKLTASAMMTTTTDINNKQSFNNLKQQQQQMYSSDASNCSGDESYKVRNSNSGISNDRLEQKISNQRQTIDELRSKLAEANAQLATIQLHADGERQLLSWQLTQTRSRLNDAEERLAFESSLVEKLSLFNTQQELNNFIVEKTIKQRLEFSWTHERQTLIEQVARCQRDLKVMRAELEKLRRAHALLSLQASQLELNNKKLTQSFAQRDKNINQTNELMRALDVNKQLVSQTKPIVDIVSKILTSIDAPPPSATATVTSTSSSVSSHAPASPVPSVASSTTSRPLTSRPLIVMATTRDFDGDDELSVDAVKTEYPAHQQRRLGRRLPSVSGESSAASVSSKAATSGTKLRVKSSSLGITPAERRSLRQHVTELSRTLAKSLELQQATQLHTQSNNNDDDYNEQHKQAQYSNNSQQQQQQQQQQQKQQAKKRALFSQAPRASSLTDCEDSQSSDLNSLTGGYSSSQQRCFVSGAESDSGLCSFDYLTSSGNKTSKLKTTKRSGGLKSRLSNSLRNISRAFGLSDSESDLTVDKSTNNNYTRRNQQNDVDQYYDETKQNKTSLAINNPSLGIPKFKSQSSTTNRNLREIQI